MEVVSVVKQKALKVEPKTVEALLKQMIDVQGEVLHGAMQKLEPLAPKEVKQEDDERFIDTEKDQEEIHPKALEYLKGLSETPQHFDTQYGPHLDDPGQFKMGNANIRFTKKTLHLMRGDIIAHYNITPELLNVLFTNTNPINVSEKTKKTYAQILNATNAIRKRYDGKSSIQGTRSQKYSAFIKPIFEEYNLLVKRRRRL